MKRVRVFGVLGVAIVAVGFVALGQRTALRRHPNEPIVTGAQNQNGWIMDGAFDGAASTPAPKSPGKFVAWLQQFFPFIADEDNCVNYTPPFVGIRLRVPSASNQFSITGRTSDGETFLFVNDTTRHWPGKDYRYETYLPLPAVTAHSRWIDMMVTEEGKQTAIWRVSNIPQLLHHDLTPTTDGTVTLTQDSTMVGSAWWNPNVQFGFPWVETPYLPSDAYDGRVPVQVELQIKQPEGNRYWKIGDPTLTEEWDVGVTGNAHSFVNCRTESYTEDDPKYPLKMIAFAAIDPSVQHAVQLKGTVYEHIRLMDRVTFRNVPFGRRGKSWYVMPGKTGMVQRSVNDIAFSLIPLVAAGNSANSTNHSENAMIQFDFRAAVGGTHAGLGNSGAILHSEVTVPGNAESADCTDGVLASNGQEMDWFGVVTLEHAPEHPGHIDLALSLHEDRVIKTLPFDITLPVHKGPPQQYIDR